MSIEPKTSVTTLSSSIRDRIIEGALKPGAALRQKDLSSDFGVSRTPIRQALNLLAGEGLVRFDGFRGACVAAISRQDVIDLFDIRLAIEPIALSTAFANFTKVDLAKAEMAIDAGGVATSDLARCEANHEFHAALYAPCEREMLLDTISRLTRTGARAEIISLSISKRIVTSETEHIALLNACKKGDLEGALTTLKSHLIAARNDTHSALSAL